MALKFLTDNETNTPAPKTAQKTPTTPAPSTSGAFVLPSKSRVTTTAPTTPITPTTPIEFNNYDTTVKNAKKKGFMSSFGSITSSSMKSIDQMVGKPIITPAVNIGVPQAVASTIGATSTIKDIGVGATQDVVKDVAKLQFKDLYFKGNYAGNFVGSAVSSALTNFTKAVKTGTDVALAGSSSAGSFVVDKIKNKENAQSFNDTFKQELEQQSKQKNLLTDFVGSLTKGSENYFNKQKEKSLSKQTNKSSVIDRLSNNDAIDKALGVPKGFLENKAKENTKKFIDYKVSMGQDPDLSIINQISIATPNLLSFVLLGGASRAGIAKLGMSEASASVTASAINTIFEAGMEADQVKTILLEQGKTPEEASVGALYNFADNVALISISNKIDGIFDKNNYTGIKRLYSYVQSGAGEFMQEGLQQVSQNAHTGKPLMEDVVDNGLIGGLMGIGGSVIFNNIAFRTGTAMPEQDAYDAIDADPGIPPDKKETVKKLVTGKLTEQEKETILKEYVQDTEKNTTFATIGDNASEEYQTLLGDIKTAIEAGHRLSSISQAIQDKYGTDASYAEKAVSQALSEVQNTPTTPTTPITPTETVVEPVVEPVIEPVTPQKAEKTVKENTTVQEELKIVTGSNNEISSATPVAMGIIGGNDVFVVKDEPNRYSVYDLDTGYLVGSSTYKSSKRVIADVTEQLIKRAKGEENLAEMFSVAKKDKKVINPKETADIAPKKKKEYNKKHEKSDNKTIQREIRAKRTRVSKSVPDSTTTTDETGGTPDTTSETIVPDGNTNGDTNTDSSKPNGERSVDNVVNDVAPENQVQAQVAISEIQPEIDAISNEIENLTTELEVAPEDVKQEIQDAIDVAEENKAEIENNFLDRFDTPFTTQEQIVEIVDTITTVDEQTQEITVKGTDEEVALAMEKVKGYKSGGETKQGRGILDEYYTDKKIVDAVYSILNVSDNATVLEPSVGIGNFVPTNVSKVDGYEINATTAGIAKLLNPNMNVYLKSFETNFIDDRGTKKDFTTKYDLVVGNPPYGDHRGLYKGLGEEESISKYEDYFTKRGLDVTKEGGYVVFVLPSSFLKTTSSSTKEKISALGSIESAYRLPENSFTGTSIGTDIVIIKKDTKNKANPERLQNLSDDAYFQANPENILGETKERKNRFGEMETYVDGSLDDALSKLNNLNIDKIAVGVAQEVGIEQTSDNINAIKAVIDESNTDVTETIKETEKENTEAEKKQKTIDEKRTKKVIERIKKASVTTSDTINLIDVQNTEFTEQELDHWKNVTKEGYIATGYKNDPNITSFYNGRWYMDFSYLQGNIYDKLDQLEMDRTEISKEQYDRQKKALEEIKPEFVKIDDVKMNANASFLREFITTGEKTLADEFTTFVRSAPNNSLGSITRSDIIGYIRGESVRGNDKDENSRVRKYRGIVANDLLNQFFTEMKETDKEMYARVEEAYNEKYNAVHIPDYSKVPLTISINNSLNGKPFDLTSVQQQGIGRLIDKGVGILAHDVGFGKTLTSILAVYQNMQNGHTKKPLFIVPKATYDQWVKTILEVIPNAKVNSLYNLADGYKGDLSTLAINDGEFNVITEEGFKSLSFTTETYEKYARKYKYVTDDINAVATKREIEKASAETAQNKGKMIRGTRSDLYFEKLGFDHIIGDEIHNANNIVTKIKMPKDRATEFRSISRPANPSIYGVKMWLASQYIQDTNNGKNVYLLSATPFTNSPMQYFSVLSLVATDTMQEMGIDNVNDFLNQFMEVDVRLEYKANGTFSERQVVQKFKNYNLFKRLMGEYIDFKSGDENPDLVRPEKLQQVNNFSKSNDYIAEEARIQGEYNPKDTLKTIGQLRALSISSSLLKGESPKLSDYKSIVENSPKLYAIAKNIANNQKMNKESGRIATEIVYSPIGVEIFPILKEYLIKEGGMSPDEIGVITGDTKTDKRTALQNEFNGLDSEGNTVETKLRVLMGTDTIGTGLNLQKRTSDIHFLGLPWNFTDLTQVEGRAWRQGNRWTNVRMNHYLMENSYDALHFQILTSKQKRYELGIKNNENTIDVGDVDIEKQLSELITDPELIADLRLNEAKKVIAEELRTKNSELAFMQKKIDKIVRLEQDIKTIQESIVYTESQLADPDVSEYMSKYYKSSLEKYSKQSDEYKKEIEMWKERYKNDGIDIAGIYEKVDPLTAEIKDLTDRLNSLSTPETKENYLIEAQNSIKPVIPFKLSDVDNVIDAYSQQNKTFYTDNPRNNPQNTVKVDEEITQETPDVIDVIDVIDAVIETKPKQAKKSTKTTKKITPTVTPELAIINDKTMTVKEKVDSLLDRKQEGKEYKDVGERISGSKKEKASIKAIYKYGDQAMFDEVMKQLGWESVLETVDKAEILSDTGYANSIQNDYDNKVPASVARAKKEIIDSIYRVPKLAGQKKGKYTWTTYARLINDESGSMSLIQNDALNDTIIGLAKVYPTIMKQFIGHVLSIKTEYPEIIKGAIYVDAVGNIIESMDNAKYKIDTRAFGMSDNYDKRPENKIKRAMEEYVPGYRNEKDEYVYSTTKPKEFKAEEYASLLNPEKIEKKTSDTRHGNFEPIDAYDITDADIAKEKVTAENLTTEYGFKSVQLGNYMDDASSYEHIQQTMGAIESMSKALGIDLKKIIDKRGLSIAFGARGGGGALAHYERTKNIINMTKKRGDGSFGHEFMHFLDFTAETAKRVKLSSLANGNRYYGSDSAGRDLVDMIINGGNMETQTFTPNDKSIDDLIYISSSYTEKGIDIGMVAGMIEKAYKTDKDIVGKSVYYLNDGGLNMNNGSTVFKITPQVVANITGEAINAKVKTYGSKFKQLSEKHLGGGKPSYWTKNEELLARAFEAYLFDKLQATENTNSYAVRDNVAQTDTGFIAYAYPQGEQRVEINKAFTRYFETLKEKYPLAENADDTQYKQRFVKIKGVPRVIKPKTVTGEFLQDAKDRLKIDFDVLFFDRIYGQSMQSAWGVTRRNSIGLTKDAPFTTEHHEFVHLTLKNLSKIEALKHLNRDDILIEQTLKMGLPIEKYTSIEVEEALADSFEDYVNKKGTFAKDSKIKQLFDYLIDQLQKMLKAIGLTNGKLIEEYYDLLNTGVSVTDEYVNLSNRREFTYYIRGNILDLTSTTIPGFEYDPDTQWGIKLKKRLEDVSSDYNSLVDEVQQNKEVMTFLSSYTDKTSLTDIVEKANTHVAEYIQALMEIERIKSDIDYTTESFLNIVKQRESIEDIRNTLDSKINVIKVKIDNTRKRNVTPTITEVADAIASTVESGDTVVEVIEPVIEPAMENTTETKTKKDNKKGISSFQNRMLHLLDEQNRDDLYYDKMTKIDEVAKAEAYYDANKKRTIAIALGKEQAPPGISVNVISLTVIEKAKQEGDMRTITKVLPKLSARATQYGQENAMLRDAFGIRDPISYMNKLIAQRKELAKKKYKPFFTSTKTAENFESLVKRKVSDARKKAPKLSDLMQTKSQEIDAFLDSITC